VTAVDFSEEAIARAKTHYGKLSINFLHASAFALPKSFDKNVDIMIEHTFFCAIPPEKRNQLVQTWNKSLVSGGLLMGVFFVTEKRTGPPFGASEWEIRERLKKDYTILFWGRWRSSPGRRQGRELFVLAHKK
jgi:ubiquinone/menaquinone biosynthesis C-methylase UbiE